MVGVVDALVVMVVGVVDIVVVGVVGVVGIVVVGGGGGGGVSWNIASVGTMSEGGSCWIFSRMSGGRIVAMYEESSGRLGTLD